MSTCSWLVKYICPICSMEYDFDDEPDFECRNCCFPLKYQDQFPVNIVCDNTRYVNGEVVDNITGYGYVNSQNNTFWYNNRPKIDDEFILSTVHKLSSTKWMPSNIIVD